MRRRFDLFLGDILDAISKIEEYTKSMNFEEFKNRLMTIDASVRNLEIIGEAVSRLPQKIKGKYANVPWQRIKDFRNVVIHKYESVDVDILWDIIKNKLEMLKKHIREILKKEKLK